jgi:hypothetical protein
MFSCRSSRPTNRSTEGLGDGHCACAAARRSVTARHQAHGPRIRRAGPGSMRSPSASPCRPMTPSPAGFRGFSDREPPADDQPQGPDQGRQRWARRDSNPLPCKNTASPATRSYAAKAAPPGAYQDATNGRYVGKMLASRYRRIRGRPGPSVASALCLLAASRGSARGYLDVFRDAGLTGSSEHVGLHTRREP